jgi:ABC-2 type transport system ATP-binding protein
MNGPAVEMVNVERQLGWFSLGPITLTIQRGVVCGLIGANGAGKTSTLDLLMGMGRPDSGCIRMLGLDPIANEVEVKRQTAYVSPDLNYQAWGRVGDALDFVSGFYPDWDNARCERLQNEFELASWKRIRSLSFGERIKLSLLMALSREAQLLLLDEPTLGLDPVSRRKLFTHLLALMQREDRTILIASHQLSELERFADEVVLLKNGQVIVHERMDQLAERYRLVVIAGAKPPSDVAGVQMIRTRPGESELLIDTKVAGVDAIEKLGCQVLREPTLSLEDLYLVLAALPANAAHWNPRAVA